MDQACAGTHGCLFHTIGLFAAQDRDTWAVQVLSQLVEDPTKLQCCGMSPEDLPLLVEKNPSIAFEVCYCAIAYTG